MTKEQAVFIVKKLVSFYPNWKVDRDIIGFWVDRLQQEDYENVTANVDEYTTSSEYPPSIAAIIKPNSGLKEGERLSVHDRSYKNRKRSGIASQENSHGYAKGSAGRNGRIRLSLRKQRKKVRNGTLQPRSRAVNYRINPEIT